MSKEEQKSLEKKLDELTDLVGQALVAARESTTPSFSNMITELRQEMRDFKNEVSYNVSKLEKKMEPVVDAYDVAGKVRKWTINLAGFLLALSGIFAFIITVKEWIKK